VLELRPRFEWNKGEALKWLREHFGVPDEDSFCIFIGDDKTDEDAQKALPPGSIGVVVTDGRLNKRVKKKICN